MTEMHRSGVFVPMAGRPTGPLVGRIRAGYAYGSLEAGSGCGSGEVRAVSDCRLKKACPCPLTLSTPRSWHK